MAAIEAELVDPLELPVISHYQFLGDNRTVEGKCAFIEHYRIKATIFHAAQAARIARSTVYKWMDEDSQFAQAVHDSFEDAADRLETSIYERAFKSDLLAMFWAKAHRHKFRDKVTIDVESIRDEIQQRMQQLGIHELPPAMIASASGNGVDSPQFADLPAQQQKEPLDYNPDQD